MLVNTLYVHTVLQLQVGSVDFSFFIISCICPKLKS